MDRALFRTAGPEADQPGRVVVGPLALIHLGVVEEGGDPLARHRNPQVMALLEVHPERDFSQYDVPAPGLTDMKPQQVCRR